MLACRAMRPDETDAVAAFAHHVYTLAIAPHESPEGRATYARYAAPDAMRARAANHAVTVAEADGALAGMLEVRDGTHVAMLFVDPARQRAGVARALLAHAFGPLARWPALTVNSTPGAVGAYARLGFVAESDPLERDGLRFVPMRRPAGAGPGTDVA
jgi:GNAT superfamily N-acetyltransferase